MTREEAINILCGIQADNLNLNDVYIKDKYEALEMAIKALEQEPKTGHWVRWYEIIEQEHCTIHDPHCKCSECNRAYDPYIASLFDYCPNCGCRMVEPQESEDNK